MDLELFLKETYAYMQSLCVEELKVEPASNEQSVGDSCRGYQIIHAKLGAKAFVMLSSEKYPMVAKEAADKALQCYRILSPSLRDHILTPLEVGVHKGLSFAIYPYCSSLPSKGLPFRWYRYKFSGKTFDWLLMMTEETVDKPTEKERDSLFKQPLQSLVDHPLMDYSLRQTAEKALKQNDWHKTVLCHGDFWVGNLLIDKTNRFKIIDWRGAKIRGIPGFDLAKLLYSWRVSEREWRRQFINYSQVIGCYQYQVVYHILSALGYLGQHLEEFPKDRYLSLTNTLWSKIKHYLVLNTTKA